jgi:hypothetical protein
MVPSGLVARSNARARAFCFDVHRFPGKAGAAL